jgi:hypothetical protein
MFINQILTKLKSLVYSKSETDSLLNGKANSSHTHTKSQITDFPTIPSKTSQLTNDSGFLTSHQSLDNYLNKSSEQTTTASKIAKGNDVGWYADSTDGTLRIRFIIGGGGENRGIWDDKLQKWMVYANNTSCYLNGNAETATKATYNANGKELTNSIIKGLSVSGRTITYTKIDGTTGTITTQDTTYTIPTKTSQLSNDSGFWTGNGGTWNPNANISLPASANNQEWSMDINRNGKTGCYWHIWDTSLGSCLRVDADNGAVRIPQNILYLGSYKVYIG